MIRFYKFLFTALISSALVFAEAPTATPTGTPATAVSAPPVSSSVPTQQPEVKKPLRQQLVDRFTKRDGSKATITIFSSDKSLRPLGNHFDASVETAFRSYGTLDVKREQFSLPAITIEEFRFTMARFNVDVLVIPVVNKDSVDLYLFDRRTPYQLYAHTEALPPGGEAAPEKTARDVTRLLVRRLLFRYLHNQYFELPREESVPVLQAEIPAWVASQESLNLINRELVSRFYVSTTLGAAVNLSRSGQLWHSNLFGFQAGIRLWDKYYLEFQLASFSYNVMAATFRRTFINRDSPFRVNVGLGFAFVTRDKVWNLDQTIGLGRYSYFFVSGVSLLFPIGEIYLKSELQMFISPSFNQFIWTYMPGIQFHF